MVDTRITRERARHHFNYGAWKYIALAVAAIFIWDLVYNATAYRPPADKKLDVYFVTPGGDTETMRADLDEALREAFPDQEEINFLFIGLGGSEDYAATMQFTTYIAAQQGDLFLMPAASFRQFGRDESGGLFVPLDGYVADGILELGDMDVTAGKLTMQGKTELYGVPAASLYALTNYGVNNHPLIWCVPAYSQNQENAARLIARMVEWFTAEKPEWYDAYQKQLTDQEQQQQMFMMAP